MSDDDFCSDSEKPCWKLIGGSLFEKREEMKHMIIEKVSSHEISIPLLERGVAKFDTLQAVLPSVLHADVGSDETVKRLEKLFRIAQMQLEHILKSQHHLLGEIEVLEKELVRRKKENKSLMATVQNDTSRQYFKCTSCEKVFINQNFLEAHFTKKHSGGK